MSDRKTLDIYDAKAAEYAELTEHAVKSSDLRSFIDAVPEHGRVLDLGCGPGHMAGQMALRGLQVDATDASAEMIKHASAQKGVTARQETFDMLDAVDRYDGIFANFSLLHAKRKEFTDHIAAITRALKSGGIFHIAMKTGSGETRDAIGRRYSYFTEAELEQILSASGLEIFRRNHGAEAGLSGEIADWVSLQAKKPAEPFSFR